MERDLVCEECNECVGRFLFCCRWTLTELVANGVNEEGKSEPELLCPLCAEERTGLDLSGSNEDAAGDSQDNECLARKETAMAPSSNDELSQIAADLASHVEHRLRELDESQADFVMEQLMIELGALTPGG